MAGEVYYTIDPSPIGELYLAATPKGLCALSFDRAEDLGAFLADCERKYGVLPVQKETPLLAKTKKELDDYFAGKLRTFTTGIDLCEGSDFDRTVWNSLLTIPFGETRSYKWLAGAVGKPKAARAVGSANGRNPIAIIIPCHRVIASDGGLGGYSGGLDIKRLLLGMEEKTARQ